MKVLDVPYLSQLNNQINPYGSCNVTSVAMAMTFVCPERNFGCPSGRQLEDFFYDRMRENGWSRHEPLGLKRLIESFGLVDDFKGNGTLNDIRCAIDSGHPVILHGFFTQFGHILVVRGYDDLGLFVNDPYGEIFWSPGSLPRYDTARSGKNLHYSYAMISALCSPESPNSPQHIWMHEIKAA